MAGKRSILIDARVNGFRGAHGLARSVMKLTAHMNEPTDGLALRVLVNSRHAQLFPLAELPTFADIVETDVTTRTIHRSWELARLIRSVGAAVLYVPYPTFTPLIRPCPFVVTVHDITLEKDVRLAGNRVRHTAIKAGTTLVLSRAAAMTAPSRASLAEITRRYPAAPHPTVVPNGVDVRPFVGVTSEAVTAARNLYQLPPKFVLSVGARRPHKNHEVLVQALANLPDHISLVIVGSSDPTFPDPLPSLISALGLESRIRLVSEVAEEHLPAVYRAASVFAFPSLSEGFGLPVLEAMAAGVPVVMSDIPVLAEVGGEAACTVPPRDATRWAGALSTVLCDEQLRVKLIAAGRAAAAAASWDRGAADLCGLLSTVANGRLPRSPDTLQV